MSARFRHIEHHPSSEYLEKRYGNLPEETLIQWEEDWIERQTTTFFSRRRRVRRLMVRIVSWGIAALAVLGAAGSVGLISLTNPPIGIITALIASFLLLGTLIGPPMLLYYRWRGGYGGATRTYRLVYPDGSDEVIPNADAYALGAPLPLGVCLCYAMGSGHEDEAAAVERGDD